MAKSALAELGAISGKQNASVHEITSLPLSQGETGCGSYSYHCRRFLRYFLASRLTVPKTTDAISLRSLWAEQLHYSTWPGDNHKGMTELRLLTAPSQGACIGPGSARP